MAPTPLHSPRVPRLHEFASSLVRHESESTQTEASILNNSLTSSENWSADSALEDSDDNEGLDGSSVISRLSRRMGRLFAQVRKPSLN